MAIRSLRLPSLQTWSIPSPSDFDRLVLKIHRKVIHIVLLTQTSDRAMDDKKQSYLSFIPRCQFITSIDKKGLGKFLIFGVREISKIAS